MSIDLGTIHITPNQQAVTAQPTGTGFWGNIWDVVKTSATEAVRTGANIVLQKNAGQSACYSGLRRADFLSALCAYKAIPGSCLRPFFAYLSFSHAVKFIGKPADKICISDHTTGSIGRHKRGHCICYGCASRLDVGNNRAFRRYASGTSGETLENDTFIPYMKGRK